MLKNVTSKQVQVIAQLARATRETRDVLLRGAPDEAVGEPHPVKGESDRMGAGGFDVLPADDPAATALRHAIDDLRPDARSELFAVMRIGQGDLAAGDWERAVSEAEVLGDTSIAEILADDIDLQSHLSKGLYELRSV
jgi:hypothetical protein